MVAWLLRRLQQRLRLELVVVKEGVEVKISDIPLLRLFLLLPSLLLLHVLLKLFLFLLLLLQPRQSPSIRSSWPRQVSLGPRQDGHWRPDEARIVQDGLVVRRDVDDP